MNTEQENQEAEPGLPGARLRWAGAALVLVLLGVLVWQAHETSTSPAPSPAPVEALALPSTIERLASVDHTRLGAQAASAVAASRAASSALPTDETEVCGIGRVKMDDSGQPRDLQPIRRAANRLRSQVLPLLAQSGDDTTRAAGLLVQALADGAPVDGADADAAMARDQLATLAAHRTSPQLYAWAMRACQRQRSEGACRMLSADQWARMEPTNAIAWLHVAADAQARRDDAALSEAMYRLSLATRSDARNGALVGVVLAKLPPQADLLSRASLAEELARIDSHAELPLVAASQYCGTAELRDANRHQLCTQVADVFDKRAGSLAEMSLAASLGERVGWPTERLAATSDERDAIAQLSLMPPPGAAWSCEALTRTINHHTEAARQGELAAWRAALKRSGVEPAVLAHQFRMATALRVASAASAASASSH